MSLLPFLLMDVFEPIAVRSRNMLRNQLMRELRPLQQSLFSDDIDTKVKMDNDKFEISIDVQQFDPSDITVRTIENNMLIVEGKHEQKQGKDGYISRHFVRRYMMPEGTNIEKVQSTLSTDGILTVTAPTLGLKEKIEKVIPIERIGKSEKIEDDKEKK